VGSRLSLLAVFGLTALALFMSIAGGLGFKQILAITIITFQTASIMAYWEYKVLFAIFGIFMLFLTGVINVPCFIESMHLDVIVFLLSMMMVVKYLEEKGFFEYIIAGMVEKIGPNAYLLVALLMAVSAASASLVGIVTAVLFLVPMILRIALFCRVNPIPFIYMISFAANIGSSATVVGNPVGVLIALEVGLSFHDFLNWATPSTLAAILLTILLSLKVFSRDIRSLNESLASLDLSSLRVDRVSRRELAKAWCLLIGVLLPLVIHDNLEHLLHLEKGSMLIIAALGGAVTAMFLERRRLRDFIEGGVDWPLLLFFMFLFASIGSLEHVGVTEIMATTLKEALGADAKQLIFYIAIIVGLLSSVLDNVLAVAFFIPVIKSLQLMGIDVTPLWWSMLFAATYFGNFTIVASTANITAVSILESRRAGKITFKDWMKYGPFFSIVPLMLALGILYIRTFTVIKLP